MEKNILISIIIPVYNVEKYLPRCLDSVLAQTIKDWECILVDDGSTDNSGRICDEYASKDGRFRVLHKENGGESAARNSGLDLAKGEYLGFIDSDDWIEKDTYEIAYNTMQEMNVDIVQWNYAMFSDKKEIRTGKRRKTGYFDKGELCTYFEPSACVKLVKGSLIYDNNLRFPVGVKLSADRLFSFMTYLFANKCFYIEKVLYHYYMRTSSISHSMTKDMIYQEIEVINKMEMLAKDKEIKDDFILSQKKDAKVHIILSLKERDFNFCREVFPEADSYILSSRTRFSFLYFFISRKMDFIAKCIINTFEFLHRA